MKTAVWFFIVNLLCLAQLARAQEPQQPQKMAPPPGGVLELPPDEFWALKFEPLNDHLLISQAEAALERSGRIAALAEQFKPSPFTSSLTGSFATLAHARLVLSNVARELSDLKKLETHIEEKMAQMRFPLSVEGRKRLQALMALMRTQRAYAARLVLVKTEKKERLEKARSAAEEESVEIEFAKKEEEAAGLLSQVRREYQSVARTFQFDPTEIDLARRRLRLKEASEEISERLNRLNTLNDALTQQIDEVTKQILKGARAPEQPRPSPHIPLPAPRRREASGTHL